MKGRIVGGRFLTGSM